MNFNSTPNRWRSRRRRKVLPNILPGLGIPCKNKALFINKLI
jgi:hypothetical protein